MGEETSAWKGCLGTIAVALALLAVIVLFGSCRSIKYVPVVANHADTLYISNNQRDSIFLHDSVFVSEKQHGDTILLTSTKWCTKYVEKQVHDTILHVRVDTVPTPYPVEVKVEKQLSSWQQFRIKVGDIALIVAALLICIGLLKLRGI